MSIPGAKAADAQGQRLIRMRRFATLLLVLMTLVYVGASIAVVRVPWLAYVRAFAEAAMVGACADWFAVVALFRQPLGLPIPHTGIVPRNKDRIGQAMGRFIADDFLIASVLSAQFQAFDPVGRLLRWMSEPIHTKRIARYIRRAVPLAVASVPREKLDDLLRQLVRGGIRATPAAPVASKILAVLWAQGQTQALIDRALDLAETSLIRNRATIGQKVAQNTSRLMPRWVDAKLAEKVMSGLLSLFAEMRVPSHPWRVEFRQAVEKLIDDLATDPVFHAQGEAIKADLLANRLFLDQIDRLCRDLETKVLADAPAHSDVISKSLITAVTSAMTWIAENEGARAGVETWVRTFAVRAIVSRRATVGAFVSRVVMDWDSTTLVEKLERQVGTDLQYIRVNGTLVGGLVGLTLFAISRWILGP